MTLLNQLKSIHNNPARGRGICSQLNFFARREFETVFIQWPKYSGHAAFPVPSTNPEYNAEEMYLMTRGDAMWDKDHPYGALRWELLEWAIDYASN